MTRFEHSVLIRRPLEDVWDYVMDPRNNPVWQGFVVEVRRADVPLRMASTVDEVVQFLGKRFDVTLEVTDHQPKRRSSIRTIAGPVPATGSYTFESVPGGTRFTVENEMNAHGVFKLAEAVFARLGRKQWASSCEVLSELLEAGVPAGTP